MRHGSRAARLNSHTNIVAMMTMTLMAFKIHAIAGGPTRIRPPGHGAAIMMMARVRRGRLRLRVAAGGRVDMMMRMMMAMVGRQIAISRGNGLGTRSLLLVMLRMDRGFGISSLAAGQVIEGLKMVMMMTVLKRVSGRRRPAWLAPFAAGHAEASQASATSEPGACIASRAHSGTLRPINREEFAPTTASL